MPTSVRQLVADDRSVWDGLWRGYLDFYKTSLPAETTDLTWQRLTSEDPGMAGLVAEEAGVVTGILHYVVHPTTWTPAPSCYLEDLFVDPEHRGAGTGRALINRLVDVARAQGWSGIHWMTADDNEAGMRLYDQVARRTTWVRYEIDL